MPGPKGDITDRIWDVIVIGTGIGGGTMGRPLADDGQPDLFVEAGAAGYRAEETRLDLAMGAPVARARRGFWPEPVAARIDGRDRSVFAPLGRGVGGSSVFYAATLERPAVHDLDDLPGRPHPTGGWPVSAAQMAPWFDRAATMYHLSGTPDPLDDRPAPALAPPLPPTPADAAIIARLQRGGLHPYQLHTALRRLDGCAACLGRKCPRPCKMDGRSAGVEPALATGRAALLDHCEVTALRGEAGQITHAEALLHGQPVTLRARRFVLAAGAFGSPRLLLASRATHWPEGCANASGLVGRNLMFHLNEMFAIWPGTRSAEPGKAVGLRDFYHVQGQRLGMVQAMGITAAYGEIAHFLRLRVAATRLHRLAGLTPLPAMVAARLLGQAQILVGLLEDLPYADNRVTYDAARPRRIAFDYRIHEELLARRKVFRRLIRRGFAGMRPLMLSWEPDLNLGHPCGTLRMGHDPATSVLDPDCRAHGIDNLHVVDASFFPTAMGVNPSLTIAAMALRVAHGMTEGR